MILTLDEGGASTFHEKNKAFFEGRNLEKFKQRGGWDTSQVAKKSV